MLIREIWKFKQLSRNPGSALANDLIQYNKAGCMQHPPSGRGKACAEYKAGKVRNITDRQTGTGP